MLTCDAGDAGVSRKVVNAIRVAIECTAVSEYLLAYTPKYEHVSICCRGQDWGSTVESNISQFHTPDKELESQKAPTKYLYREISGGSETRLL